MIANAATAPSQAPSNSFRWMQLIIGVVCMAMIANLQYGWTYFVGPMAKANSWDVAGIQVAFSIFVALETWLTPLEGWIVNSLGPARSETDGRGRRRFRRARLAHQRQGRVAGDALSRRRRVGHRRRRHLCHLRRQCREMVSRSPRSRRRPDGGRIWRRRGRHGDSDSDDDCLDRICRHLLLVRDRSGRRHLRAGMVPSPAAAGRGSERIRRQGPAIEDLEHAGPDAGIAGVLAALRHVRAGVRQRIDGRGADRVDRQGLRRRADRDPVRRHAR